MTFTRSLTPLTAPEIDWQRWHADDPYRAEARWQQLEWRCKEAERVTIEITRAELEEVKAEVAARPAPPEPEIDWKRYYADDTYRAAMREQEREKRRTAILDSSDHSVRAWVETKDENTARRKREDALDWKRWYADNTYRDEVREHRWKENRVIYIKLKDFERPAASPSPA